MLAWESGPALLGSAGSARELCESVLAEIRARGPMGVSDLKGAGRRRAGWWGWSEGKVALEWLFWTGQITTTHRRRFERVYDLTERALPSGGHRRTHARARGRAAPTAAYRNPGARSRDGARPARLFSSPDRGRERPHRGARGGRCPTAGRGRGLARAGLPGSRRNAAAPVAARALLSPFDSLVWERQRTERLFGFRYRLEIYTPAKRREHGYYVLPFLLGDRLVARVDLKADRPKRTLRVVRAHCESDADPDEVASALRGELGGRGLARPRTGGLLATQGIHRDAEMTGHVARNAPVTLLGRLSGAQCRSGLHCAAS